MTAGKYNIITDQGSTFYFKFTVLDDTVPRNLSTYGARMQVRPHTSAKEIFLDLSEDAGDITLSSLGVVQVTVSAERMSQVPQGKHYYDIELVSAGGEVARILQGRFVVDDEVTR